MLKKLLFIVLLGTTVPVTAQTFIAAEEQFSFSLELMQTIFFFVNIDYGVTNYRVTYTSTDAMGQPDTLSGFVAIPQTDEVTNFPITIYNHATIFVESDAPSVPDAQERPIVDAAAGSGYIAVAPDYLGYGVDADEFHPYLHAASEAQAGKDLILAVREWLDQQDNIGYNNQLFTMGYSQGGHSSAALHRMLQDENDPTLQITAAAHLAGPYNITQSDPFLIFADQVPAVPGYTAFRFAGYNLAYGWYEDNSGLFVEPYLSAIDSFTNGHYELLDIDARLISLFNQQGEGLKDMFQPDFLQILADNDPTNAIVADNSENDVFAWAPQAPTRLVYCTGDMTVPPVVAITTDSIMNALGSPDVETLIAGSLGHFDCAQPAAIAAINFFNQFAETVSTEDLSRAEADWTIGPNPINRGGQLFLTTNSDIPERFELFDLMGRRMQSGIINGQTIDLANLVAGQYYLHLRKGQRRAVRVLVVE